MRRIACLTAFAAVALGLTAVAPTASAAPATAAAAPAPDAKVDLGVTSFQDIVVDDAHGHVFVTAGGSTGVLVRDLAGAAVATIPNQPGANGMALSPDGGTLYVALPLGDAISAISTTTLAETARYSTGAETCPHHVAAIGSHVWFGYGCGSGGIGLLDLGGEEPAVTLGKAPQGHWFSVAPYLEVRAGDPVRMTAGHWGHSPSYVSSLTVAGTTLTGVARRDVGSNLRDFAMTADGAQVVTASGYPYHHPRYQTADMAADGVFGNALHYPNAVAITGGFVAAGTNAAYDEDIRVYKADGTLVREYETGGQYHTIEPHSLAFTADGGTLYAVSGSYSDTSRMLHVLREPTKAQTTVLLERPASPPKTGAAYTVTGQLYPTAGGHVLHVTRTSQYGTVALPDVTTGSGGTFSFTDTVTKRGVYTYTATFDGDATYAASAGSAGVRVLGLTAPMSISTNASTYAYRATATATAHLGSTVGRVVKISAKPYGLQTATLKTGTVDGNGNLSASLAVGRRTTFYAYFAGDETYEPRTVYRTVTVRAALTQSLSGYYGTSGSYRLYRVSRDPVINARVAPNRAGTCMTFTAQAYYGGAWHTTAQNNCVPLDSASAASGVLGGTHSTAYRYRLRSTFNGDTYNAKTVGGWLYLRFTG